MSNKILCACCDARMTHQDEDGFPRCENHRLKERSLPAAVPVVDVERAAEVYETQATGYYGGPCLPSVAAAAILDAGIVGSVSVEDVRAVAKAALALFALGDAKEIAPEIAAAKRLLAATEGR